MTARNGERLPRTNHLTHPAVYRRPRFPEGHAAYLLKATETEMAQWQSRARAEGLSFAEFLRRALRFRCALPLTGIPRAVGPVQPLPATQEVAAVPTSTRHRGRVTLRSIETSSGITRQEAV